MTCRPAATAALASTLEHSCTPWPPMPVKITSRRSSTVMRESPSQEPAGWRASFPLDASQRSAGRRPRRAWHPCSASPPGRRRRSGAPPASRGRVPRPRRGTRRRASRSGGSRSSPSASRSSSTRPPPIAAVPSGPTRGRVPSASAIHASPSSIPTVPPVPVTATKPRAGPGRADVLQDRLDAEPMVNRAEYESSTFRSGAAALTSIDALTERNGPSQTRSWSRVCDPFAPSHPPIPGSSNQLGMASASSACSRNGEYSTTVASRGSPMAPAAMASPTAARAGFHRNS